MTIDEINEILARKGNLDSDQASFAMGEILNGRVNDQELGLFITLLHDKGETVTELSAIVNAMWANAPSIDGIDVSRTLDTCGTGGDKSGTFNISTAVSLVLASIGIKIAKHGNRAASSKCGAADVLEGLNIYVDLTPSNSAELFKQTGFTFLFAPTYHPGMRYAAPIRKSLGVPTTFNFLGPLANPYHAPYRMHGISKPGILETYIKTLDALKVKKALVFHGAGGIDEISLSGISHGYLLDDGNISKIEIDPSQYGFEPAELSDLAGSDVQTNASIIKSIFDGEPGPCRDIVVLNAAYGYDLVNQCGVENAIEIVGEALSNGKVKEKVAQIQEVSQSLHNSQ